MAMIRCPECGNDVSNQATSCPNCGYPISSQIELQIRVHMDESINVVLSFLKSIDMLLRSSNTFSHSGNSSNSSIYEHRIPIAGIDYSRNFVLPRGVYTLSFDGFPKSWDQDFHNHNIIKGSTTELELVDFEFSYVYSVLLMIKKENVRFWENELEWHAQTHITSEFQLYANVSKELCRRESLLDQRKNPKLKDVTVFFLYHSSNEAQGLYSVTSRLQRFELDNTPVLNKGTYSLALGSHTVSIVGSRFKETTYFILDENTKMVIVHYRYKQIHSDISDGFKITRIETK